MKIIELIGPAALYEQLAEECAELGKAAIKMARIIRGDNPTPVTTKEVMEAVKEEYTDVVHCALELSLVVNLDQIIRKDERWRIRISGE